MIIRRLLTGLLEILLAATSKYGCPRSANQAQRINLGFCGLIKVPQHPDHNSRGSEIRWVCSVQRHVFKTFCAPRPPYHSTVLAMSCSKGAIGTIMPSGSTGQLLFRPSPTTYSGHGQSVTRHNSMMEFRIPARYKKSGRCRAIASSSPYRTRRSTSDPPESSIKVGGPEINPPLEMGAAFSYVSIHIKDSPKGKQIRHERVAERNIRRKGSLQSAVVQKFQKLLADPPPCAATASTVSLDRQSEPSYGGARSRPYGVNFFNFNNHSAPPSKQSARRDPLPQLLTHDMLALMSWTSRSASGHPNRTGPSQVSRRRPSACASRFISSVQRYQGRTRFSCKTLRPTSMHRRWRDNNSERPAHLDPDKGHRKRKARKTAPQTADSANRNGKGFASNFEAGLS